MKNIIFSFSNNFYFHRLIIILLNLSVIININCQHLVGSERGCRSSVECIPSPLRYSHPVHFYSPLAARLNLSLLFFVGIRLTNGMLHSSGEKITSSISAQCRGFWPKKGLSSASRLYMTQLVEEIPPATGMEDKNMKNETRNDEAVSPVIATILMVAITVVLAGVLYVWAANLAESNTNGDLALYSFSGSDAPDDNGVLVTMSQGADVNHASIDVKVSINGGQGSVCALTTCYTDADGGSTWDTGEDLLVSADCGETAPGQCTVTVTVFDNRENTQIGNEVSVAMDETA